MPGLVIRPGAVRVPETVDGRFPILREAVLTLPSDPAPRQWRWVPLGTLRAIVRDDALYQRAAHCAGLFLGQMRARGYEPLDTADTLLLAGPVAHLPGETGGAAIGGILGHESEQELADFYLRGRFLRRRPLTFEYRKRHSPYASHRD